MQGCRKADALHSDQAKIRKQMEEEEWMEEGGMVGWRRRRVDGGVEGLTEDGRDGQTELPRIDLCLWAYGFFLLAKLGPLNW